MLVTNEKVNQVKICERILHIHQKMKKEARSQIWTQVN